MTNAKNRKIISLYYLFCWLQWIVSTEKKSFFLLICLWITKCVWLNIGPLYMQLRVEWKFSNDSNEFFLRNNCIIQMHFKSNNIAHRWIRTNIKHKQFDTLKNEKWFELSCTFVEHMSSNLQTCFIIFMHIYNILFNLKIPAATHSKFTWLFSNFLFSFYCIQENGCVCVLNLCVHLIDHVKYHVKTWA